MLYAMVSGSFPHGLTSPVSSIAVPVPPTMPPCHTYSTASGVYLSIKPISNRAGTLSSTIILSKCALTLRSISSSSSVSRKEPAFSLLSISSPAVLPMITTAVFEVEAALMTSSSVSGISS